MYKATKLLIARHGNTFGPLDIVRRVGVTDLPLVDSGLLQARMLSDYLKQNNLIPDIIFTSKLKRATQTAIEVQKNLPTTPLIEELSIFNEIDYGIDENQPEDKVIARLGKEALRDWDKYAKVPDGWKVSPQEIIGRWQDFTEKLINNYIGKIILVISSNGIIRFAPYLTGDFMAFSAHYEIKISTGALGIFEQIPSTTRWTCLNWNVKP